jgi:hypothetical protein
LEERSTFIQGGIVQEGILLDLIWKKFLEQASLAYQRKMAIYLLLISDIAYTRMQMDLNKTDLNLSVCTAH